MVVEKLHQLKQGEDTWFNLYHQALITFHLYLRS